MDIYHDKMALEPGMALSRLGRSRSLTAPWKGE
jgi:hypothetical protein